MRRSSSGIWRRVDATLEAAARGLATLGGLVLLAMAAVTVLSIAGRALPGFAPVRGDFELVEMGCAVAVFLFLPWAQLTGSHLGVHFVAERLPTRARAVLEWLGSVALALVACVILWRLWLGLGERFPFGGVGLREAIGFGPPPFFAETTYELQIPLWIPYALCTLGAALFAAGALRGVVARSARLRAP